MEQMKEIVLDKGENISTALKRLKQNKHFYTASKKMRELEELQEELRRKKNAKQ